MISDSMTADKPTSTPSLLRDLVSLSKPRLSSLVIFTGGIGLWLSPGKLAWDRSAGVLAALVLVVAAANTLNNFLERDSDRDMPRTATRPLPMRRLSPRVALVQGLVLTAISVPLLTALANPLTGGLGALALLSYVLVYTPLKRKSSLATIVGALPGAIPPLIGWTSATNALDAGGLALFAVLFTWQLPHFLAIGLYRAEEYAAAGLMVHALEIGPERTRTRALLWTIALVISSAALVWTGVGGWLTGATAALLGLGFLRRAAQGLRPEADNVWARGLFRYSLVYLTVLFAVMAVDKLIP